MDFKELEKKYNLDFNKLAQILKKQHINLKLEHLNDIPVEWIPVIEESLGLRISKEDEKKINHFRVELKDDAIKLFKEYLSKIIL